jgi:hypothetical protein
MKILKDITETQYKQISESTFTPIKLRNDWASKVIDGKSAMQLFITKNFDLNINEYHLLIGIPFESNYLILSYLCEQPPTFVISDICNIIANNIKNHGNNLYLINQYLNGSGYKNLEHIVMDIFTQEMSLKMGQNYVSETATLFSDYLFLIQRSMTDVQHTMNSLDLADEDTQNFFFSMLAIEESIKKLNQEFMYLYFCFYKVAEENRINRSGLVPVLKSLKRTFFQKINHHIQALRVSLINVPESETVSIQLEHMLMNLELFQKKEAHIMHPSTLNNP